MGSFKGHDDWIISVRQPESIGGDLLLASISGEIRRWQLNQTRQIVNVSPFTSLLAMEGHSQAPILACATQDAVKIYDSTDGTQISHLRQHKGGFLAQRMSPVTGVAWHPRRLMLAVSTSDSLLNIYSARL